MRIGCRNFATGKNKNGIGCRKFTTGKNKNGLVVAILRQAKTRTGLAVASSQQARTKTDWLSQFRNKQEREWEMELLQLMIEGYTNKK